MSQRKAIDITQVVVEKREPPTILSCRVVLALARRACDPTVAGVCEFLGAGVHRSTVYRLLSRLVEAGILTRRVVRRRWVPPTAVYAVAPEFVRAPRKKRQPPAPEPTPDGAT